MPDVPRWLKRKKQRMCRSCGGAPLDDIARKEATFWCSACERLWRVTRNQHGDVRVKYIRPEGGT